MVSWRHCLAAADLSLVVVTALVDRWTAGVEPTDFDTAGILLVVPLLWAYTAPTRAWGWSISALLAIVLLGCLWASRGLLSHGPAAPDIDWLLPYATISIAVCLAALALSRSRQWVVVGVLVLLLAACVGGGKLLLSFDDENAVRDMPVSDAAPWGSGLSVDRASRSECGQNSALCERMVYIRTSLTPEEVRSILRQHGWRQDCLPVTGIMTAIGQARYGNRCVFVDAATDGTVIVSLLGKADWWSYNEGGR